MSKKYRKKPIEIEAILFTGLNTNDVMNFVGNSTEASTEVRNCSSDHPEGFDYPCIRIHTLEGAMTASIGDYVIKGVHGEFYPCKPDIFKATYDE